MNKSSGIGFATSLAILVVMAGCGGVSGPSTASCQGPSQSGTITVITEVDSGRCFNLAVDRTGELRLTEQYQWSEPKLSGDAVQLILMNALVDPGYSAWEIRARRSGTTTISASGVCAVANCTKPTLALNTIVVS